MLRKRSAPSGCDAMSTHHHPALLWLAVALGSGTGAVCRYLVALAFTTHYPSALPWPTLLVNALGSALIGWAAAHSAPGARWHLQPIISHALMVGFCGGFTTFSLFSYELWQLLQHHASWAIGYLLISWIIWLAAAWAGFQCGSQATRNARPTPAPSTSPDKE